MDQFEEAQKTEQELLQAFQRIEDESKQLEEDSKHIAENMRAVQKDLRKRRGVKPSDLVS